MTVKRFFRDLYLAARAVPLAAAGALFKKERASGISPCSILAIRIDRIGDLIVSLPALKALKLTFPEARMTVLAAEENVSLLKIFPWIDEVIAYRGFTAAIRMLRDRRFDLAIDLLMDYTLRTALLAALSGSKLTVGFDVSGRGCCFGLKVASTERKKHVSLYMLDLAGMVADHFNRRLDKAIEVDFSIPSEDREFAGSLIKNSGINEKDIIIGVHPGGHYASQCWPIERFARLADMVMEEFGAKILIMGSAGERSLVDGMAGMMKGAAVKIMGLPLDKLAALIAETDLFVCNNSGPWHIACAIGIPTVSTMGPTDYHIWWPVKRGHIVLKKEMSCSPCDLAVCSRHDCMKMISIEDMARGVRAQIRRINEGRG
ncbi:MAG: glycosyltransferase family 9 protein [Candidatus Omnitrophica bacterium]|nr:glycosyltransferase family 9 protein [Candidatus Omnitrophota bacterium]